MTQPTRWIKSSLCQKSRAHWEPTYCARHAATLRDKVRIDMHLEDVADSKRLWSREFDGAVGDLFTLEDQIYNQLVSGLDVNPTNDELACSGDPADRQCRRV